GHLDRFKNPFSAAFAGIVKAWQSQDPFHQISEAHYHRINIRMCFLQGVDDFVRICPAHQWFSLAWLIVYLGISMVRSSSARIAWHESRELASRPHARSR